MLTARKQYFYTLLEVEAVICSLKKLCFVLLKSVALWFCLDVLLCLFAAIPAYILIVFSTFAKLDEA